MKPALQPEDHLTEENIIRATLSFLKAYYRKRQRAGETVVSSGMRGQGGIIADGYLAFLKEDGNRFVATFEATSRSKRNEVIYRPDRRTMIWDGIALGTFGASGLMVYSYLADFFTIQQIGELGVIACLVGSFVLIFFFFQLFCLLFEPRRYRYIYAIEQFKRYHVNEQWIAVADDVFPGKKGRYFRELQHQCIYNGFGLITVSVLGEQLRPVLSITPSREGLFGHRRRLVRFFEASELASRLKLNRPREWWRYWSRRYPVRALGIEPERLDRFQRRFYKQLLFTLFSLLIIGAIYVREKQETQIYEPDEEEILAELRYHRENPGVQPLFYKLDTPEFYPPPFDRTVAPYLPIREERTTPSGPEAESGPPPEAPLRDERGRIVVGPGGEDYVFYDCARFYNYRDTKYVILEGIYDDVEIALMRMGQINETGVAAGVLWLGCFMEWENGYAVYLDLLYDNQEEAMITARSYEKMLAPEETGGWLEVRSLSPLRR